jgi:hypothetical protein
MSAQETLNSLVFESLVKQGFFDHFFSLLLYSSGPWFVVSGKQKEKVGQPVKVYEYGAVFQKLLSFKRSKAPFGPPGNGPG